MEKIESTPFFLNTPYGLRRQDNRKVIPGRYFKILEVIENKITDEPTFFNIGALSVTIQYYKDAEDKEGVPIKDVVISAEASGSEIEYAIGSRQTAAVKIPPMFISLEKAHDGGRRRRRHKGRKTVKARKSRKRNTRRRF